MLNLLHLDQTSDAALALLLHRYKNQDFRVKCDSKKAEITLYHAAAYRGLVKFVKHLLEERKLYKLDVNCPNKHGATPMNLAELCGRGIPGVYSPWALVIDAIEKHGGELSYLHTVVNSSLLYKYIHGDFFWTL